MSTSDGVVLPLVVGALEVPKSGEVGERVHSGGMDWKEFNSSPPGGFPVAVPHTGAATLAMGHNSPPSGGFPVAVPHTVAALPEDSFDSVITLSEAAAATV